MDIAVERKICGKRIVVEVIASADMVETDVIIDRVTGEVLGTEKWLPARGRVAGNHTVARTAPQACSLKPRNTSQ